MQAVKSKCEGERNREAMCVYVTNWMRETEEGREWTDGEEKRDQDVLIFEGFAISKKIILGCANAPSDLITLCSSVFILTKMTLLEGIHSTTFTA